MYCSTCGAIIPEGRRECATCGSTLGSIERLRIGRVADSPIGPAQVLLAPSTLCPRCDYEGQGIPYFNRGSHMAGLVAATILTLPGAVGAGGMLYYWLRHNHEICPRCGFGWGKHSERALPVRVEPARQPMSRSPGVVRSGAEGAMRVWSYILLALAALAFGVGLAELEPVLFVFGTVFAGGGLLLRHGANRAREKRREAMLASLQMHVLRLAGERKGRLTVSEVAAALSWPIRRAEKVLNSLDDGWRVNSEVTDEGLIVYEFRELLARGDTDRSFG